jgi:hypothetical protein
MAGMLESLTPLAMKKTIMGKLSKKIRAGFPSLAPEAGFQRARSPLGVRPVSG